MQTGILQITRLNQNINKLVRIKIYLDGKLLYAIPDNTSKSFDIPKGRHVVSASLDWCRSNKLVVEISEGELYQIEVGSPLDVDLKPVSLVIDVAILILPPALDVLLNIDLSFIYLLCIAAWLFWKIFLTKSRSLIYYLTFGYKEYLFLRLVNAKSDEHR